MTDSRSRSDPGAPAERRRLGRVRWAGAMIGVVMLLALIPTASRARLDNAVFDLFQRLSPRDLSGMRAVVVEIDSESLKLIGPWPWSRYDLARLTERIAAAGAVAIGYDMVFPEPDRQTPRLFVERYPELTGDARDKVLALPTFDNDFADTLGRYPTVLARAGVTEGSVDYGEAAYSDPARLPVDAVFAIPLPRAVASWPQAIASRPEIEENAAGHGLINGDPDADGIVRGVPAVGRIANTDNSGFALELLRVASGADRVTPRLARGALRAVSVGPVTVPVDARGRMRLHFGRMPPGSVISAAQLFRRGFDRGSIAGKVVVLGETGAGGVDIVATPLAPREYGPYIQAQAADAMVRGGWLTRPAWALAAELALGCASAALALLLVGRVAAGIDAIVAAGLTLAIVACAWFAFTRAGLLLDPLIPLMIGAAAAGGAFVALYLETTRVQRRLRAALLDQRLAAARAAGELEAARNIQQGMLPPGAQLAALDARIDLDARLEPAREIGGDFYDAFALPDGRILFMVGDVTGKGVPAALFMALSKALARSAIERHLDDLGAAVATLSAELSRDNSEDMFVTLLIGTVDPANGALALVNAGHENPLVRRAGGAVEELAMAGGPPVCVADDFPYETERFALGVGDGLIVVTDGVTEAQDATGGFLDRAGALAVLAALAPGWRADEATVALMTAVRVFEDGTEPSDDLTVLALRRPAATVSGR